MLSRKASFNETVWLLGSFMLCIVVILAIMLFVNSQKSVMEKGIASFSQFGGATVLKKGTVTVSFIRFYNLFQTNTVRENGKA